MQKQSVCIKCKNNLFQTLLVILCVRSKQPCTIKTIIYNDIFASLRRKKVHSPAKKFKELFSLVCIELPENCIYLNQSELSNFLMYLIRKVPISVCVREAEKSSRWVGGSTPK